MSKNKKRSSGASLEGGGGGGDIRVTLIKILIVNSGEMLSCIRNFLITYSHASVPNLVKNSHHEYDQHLLQAIFLFRADGYHNKPLSEDTPMQSCYNGSY